jgi:hypothetical protein
VSQRVSAKNLTCLLYLCKLSFDTCHKRVQMRYPTSHRRSLGYSNSPTTSDIRTQNRNYLRIRALATKILSNTYLFSLTNCVFFGLERIWVPIHFCHRSRFECLHSFLVKIHPRFQPQVWILFRPSFHEQRPPHGVRGHCGIKRFAHLRKYVMNVAKLGNFENVLASRLGREHRKRQKFRFFREVRWAV